MFVKKNTLTIISRKSRLALRQAEIIKQHLHHLHPTLPINIIGISTLGDLILDKPLNKIGGKGLFVNELEKYLLEEKADIAVHSMKDLPAVLAPGLGIGAILARADPRDVLVSVDFNNIWTLPPDSIIGTSSLRRQTQLLALRENLNIIPLRGNVETRLQQLMAGNYAAIILAAAGLERLDLGQWLNNPFTIQQMLPAPGQGALGIEYKTSNQAIGDLIAPLNDFNTSTCVNAERAMNAKLDGGCQAPIAGFASITNQVLTLHGLVAALDGKTIYRATQTGPIESAKELGIQVAEQLLGQGAGEIITQLKSSWQHNGW